VTAPASDKPAAGRARVPVPPSGHRDANWYRRAATKTSAAQPDPTLSSGVSDDDAWAVVSHIAAGIILYGGLGWLLGTWLGHRPHFIAGGVLLGVSLALFMLFRRLESKATRARDAARGPATTGPRTEVAAPMPVMTGTTARMASEESSRVR